MWLQSQTAKEGKLYIEFFDKKWQAFINEMNCVHLDTYLILDRGDEQSIKVVENFSASAAARLFEQEIREAVSISLRGILFLFPSFIVPFIYLFYMYYMVFCFICILCVHVLNSLTRICPLLGSEDAPCFGFLFGSTVLNMLSCIIC